MVSDGGEFLEELVFVYYLHAELPGFVCLGACVLACYYEISFCRYARCNSSASCGDCFAGLVAREIFQRAGNHDDQPS